MISVVIPSYNRRSALHELLTSVFTQRGTDFEVVVVDDCSSDGSAEMVSELFLKSHLIVLDQNGGPAIARNVGIRECRGDIVVGLDSDVVLPNSNCLRNVKVLFDDHPELMCAAFRILNKHTGKDDELRWWHPFPFTQYSETPFFTDYFSGTAYAFRRNLFDVAGFFPEDLFMDMEENDLSYRILDAGIDIRYSPEITVIHDRLPSSENPHITFYYKRRNQIWVAFRYLPWCRIPVYVVPRVFKTLVLSLIRGHCRMYLKGLWDGICGLHQVLQTRRPLKAATRRRIRWIRSGRYRVMET